ncbi:zinc finger protein 778-like [Anopheles cruzii]|uniref:zinc finger protein 778-like n=1 Tax=Anopheles cruzii TaxID=68878 RepID=UPI0022EC5BA7|nr:zinc finger protein 778-like [Anopheles cruzii]
MDLEPPQMQLPEPLPDDIDEAAIARAILSGNPATCRMCLWARPRMFKIDEEEHFGSLTLNRITKISKVKVTPLAGTPSFLCMDCKSFLLEWDAANREVARTNDMWVACHVKREWESTEGVAGVTKYQKTKRGGQLRYEWECEECGKPYLSLYAVTLHVLEHKKAGRFRCDICDERCLSIEELNEHFANHDDEQDDSNVSELSLKPEPEPEA